jgi:hypothetical protein
MDLLQDTEKSCLKFEDKNIQPLTRGKKMLATSRLAS